MKRDYSSGVTDAAKLYTGIEIEHTPAYGLKTLFVVGLQNGVDVINMARAQNCEHIYFGANASFRPEGIDDHKTWESWKDMVMACIVEDFWCTLDMDISIVEGLLETELSEYYNFIPMISAKIPYAKHLGYNAVVKIDDKDFKASNPGVWCHNLHDLMDRNKFTDWSQYGKDDIIS